jgi:N-acetylglucosaminyldiphosphoundecaprenol N-acetyl-beta-D-mannosaminyltransferase
MGIARRASDRRASAPGSRTVRKDVNGGRPYSHSRVAKMRLLLQLVEKMGSERELARNYRSRQILGVRFFGGDVDEAVAFMFRQGGFLVAPSGTCFTRLQDDESYRLAMLAADLAIADSGLIVLLWRLLRGEKVTRISGLKYLKHLLTTLKGEGRADVFWVLPSEGARQKLLDWSRHENFFVKVDHCYVAPQYEMEIEDRHLLARVEESQPTHVVIAIGSGAQEKLGYFLRENLSYRPAIHCIGAALGFITGDQIAIPDWADRFYLGWFLRLLAQPRRFIPRLSSAHKLPWLIWKYGENMPPMAKHQAGKSN